MSTGVFPVPRTLGAVGLSKITAALRITTAKATPEPQGEQRGRGLGAAKTKLMVERNGRPCMRLRLAGFA
jgi:hypothetical protein